MTATVVRRDLQGHRIYVCVVFATLRGHCTGLFTADKNADLRSQLFQVPIEKGDGLPSMVCRSCFGKFMTIGSKLKTLKPLAQASYQT